MRERGAYIEGNAAFFCLLLLIVGAVLLGVVWGIAWMVVGITQAVTG